MSSLVLDGAVAVVEPILLCLEALGDARISCNSTHSSRVCPSIRMVVQTHHSADVIARDVVGWL